MKMARNVPLKITNCIIHRGRYSACLALDGDDLDGETGHHEQKEWSSVDCSDVLNDLKRLQKYEKVMLIPK